MTELLRIRRQYNKLFSKALKQQNSAKASECTNAIIKIDEILIQVADVKQGYSNYINNQYIKPE